MDCSKNNPTEYVEVSVMLFVCLNKCLQIFVKQFCPLLAYKVSIVDMIC